MVSLEMLYNILIYSLISELLIFAFLNYVLASCFILSEMDDILAHFLQPRCLYLYLNVILILICLFEFTPTYKYTCYLLLSALYYHNRN